MNFSTYRTLIRCFQQAKELSRGIQSLSPAANLINHPSTSLQSNMSCTQTNHLLQTQSLILHQVRGIRKLYPDPFEQDPEYFILPEEKTHLDLHHVPELDNNGPVLSQKVQEAVNSNTLGRLFAIVYIGGEQRKITQEDMILVNGFFPPQIGDKIRLEKVMLVGGKDFTLFGRPLLDRNLVKVEATVIEKTLSHVKVHYTQLKRYRRLKLHQNRQTVLVINSIEVDPSSLSQS
ncbi:39S ribosomal protein L21 [Mactra antiquata]